MANMIKEAFDVCLNHPLGFLLRNHFRDPPQSIMGTSGGRNPYEHSRNSGSQIACSI